MNDEASKARLVELLWGAKFPKGGRDEHIRLDANAAHAIAAAVVAAGFIHPAERPSA